MKQGKLTKTMLMLMIFVLLVATAMAAQNVSLNSTDGNLNAIAGNTEDKDSDIDEDEDKDEGDDKGEEKDDDKDKEKEKGKSSDDNESEDEDDTDDQEESTNTFDDSSDDTNSTSTEKNATSNSTEDDNSGKQNMGTLSVTTSPINALVTINGTTKTSPANFTLPADKYTVKISNEGYASINDTVTISGGKDSSKSYSLQEVINGNSTDTGTNETEDTNSTEVEDDSETNTTEGNRTDRNESQAVGKTITITESESVVDMYETDTLVFSKNFNEDKNVTWTLNGDVIAVTSGKDNDFNWTPGPLFTANQRDVQLRAKTDGWEDTWDLHVKYVVNPYFSGIDGASLEVGDADARINVFVNMDAYDFTRLSAVITTKGTEKAYSLSPFVSGNEVHWSRNVKGLPEGNNYITSIFGHDDYTDSEIELDLGKERAHYRQESFPENREEEDDEDDERVQGAFSDNVKPDLVYSVFEKDVLKEGEMQTLKLDAVNFNGGVDKVIATILSPDGERIELDLELTVGSKEYGTWEAQFDVKGPGKYILESVILSSPLTRIDVEGRSFHIVDENTRIDSKLMLVYTLIDQSVVSNGTNVTITADIVDSLGIENAFITVENSKEERFNVTMVLEEGSRNYGTWKGTILAEYPDSTYSIVSMTLSNRNMTQTHEIESRSFYVKSLPNQSLLSNFGETKYRAKIFSEEWFKDLTNIPLFPTMLGFGVMFLAALIWGVGFKLAS